MRSNLEGDKILKSSLEVRIIVNRSRRWRMKGAFDYCYVYLHKINDIVFYVGMGSDNRAIKVDGRSCLWYKTAILEKIVVEIVTGLLSREEAEKIEQEYISRHSGTVINYQYEHLKTIPVVQLNRDGTLVREYQSIEEATDNGFFNTCISECCKGVRGLHKNFVWMYKNDYEKNGFQAKLSVNRPKTIQQTDMDGNIIRTLVGCTPFKQYGFDVNNIQQVCTGKKKTHLGFKFKYIDNY